MKSYPHRWLLFTLSCVLWLVIGITGCHREQFNFREMTPEEQFDYAKRIFDKKDYLKAKMQFSIIVLNNPGNKIIEEAQFYLAESYYYDKEYLLAIEEYEKLIRSMPQSTYVDDARYKIGMSYYELSPGYALDQEYTNKAILQFQHFLEEFPQSNLRPEVEKKLVECWSKLAEKEFKTGVLYRKMSYLNAALISFDNVLQNYYESEFAPEALYWKGYCHRRLQQWDEAEEAFKELIEKHVQSEWASRAEGQLKAVEEARNKQSEDTEVKSEL